MKVENNIFTNKANKTNNIKSSKSKKSKKSATNSSSSTLVSLSELSDTIAAETNSTEVPFDEIKVQEIKNAIAEGKFTINTEAIADGILNMAFDLIKKR